MPASGQNKSSPPSNPELSLVVPVHHNSGALAPELEQLAAFVANAPVPTELLLVDDRGSHESSRVLEAFAARAGVRLVRNQSNLGKGYSVSRGILEATGRYRVFTDVDLAYPLSEVWRIVDALRAGADVAIACRVHPDSEYVMSASFLRYIFTRHVSSRVFNFLARIALVPGILDTQAGLKGFTATAAESVFRSVRIAGFGFDLEALFLARKRGFKVAQIPVRFQYRDEPSTVSFLRDGAAMLGDLVRIRLRDWAGAYALSSEESPSPRAPEEIGAMSGSVS